jgi:pimeloyl-ACP methyl ester carboxylesterase
MQALGGRVADFEVIRRGLFSADVPAEECYRLLPLFEQRESLRVNLELMFPQRLAPSPRLRLPVLVTGGDSDVLVPLSELVTAAIFWNADLKVLDGVPHAMMLDTTWRRGADTVLAWLRARF